MGYLKIHCHKCDGEFTVYWDDMQKERMICPHCLSMMDDRQWKKLIDAYFTLEEVNKGLREVHEQNGKPLLQAEYCTHYVNPRLY